MLKNCALKNGGRSSDGGGRFAEASGHPHCIIGFEAKDGEA